MTGAARRHTGRHDPPHGASSTAEWRVGLVLFDACGFLGVLVTDTDRPWDDQRELRLELWAPFGASGLTECSGLPLVFDIMATVPMFDEWSRFIVEAGLARRRRPEVHISDRKGRGRWRPVAHPAAFERAYQLFEADDLGQITVATSMGGRWSYSLSVVTPCHLLRGEWMSGWVSFVLEMKVPASAQAQLPVGLIRGLTALCEEVAPALGAPYGAGRLSELGVVVDPRGYGLGFLGAPQSDPSDLPGAQWLTVLPPRVVDRLGGLESIGAGAVHELEEIHYRDGRVGAVAVVTPQPAQFEGEAARRWAELLRPVLRSPVDEHGYTIAVPGSGPFGSGA